MQSVTSPSTPKEAKAEKTLTNNSKSNKKNNNSSKQNRQTKDRKKIICIPKSMLNRWSKNYKSYNNFVAKEMNYGKLTSSYTYKQITLRKVTKRKTLSYLNSKKASNTLRISNNFKKQQNKDSNKS